MIEEFGRHGVETRFLNAPSSATAEDQLLVQFQGMIAEYERAPRPPLLFWRVLIHFSISRSDHLTAVEGRR